MNKCTDFEKFFQKKFDFSKKSDWILPPNELIYKDDLWHVDILQNLKVELNTVKSMLNDKGNEWHDHTASISKSKLVNAYIRKIFQPDLLTQAWCKFYEILSSYRLFPEQALSLKTLHLCEAPGAFISALSCFLNAKCPKVYWDWTANTLNPYYEDISIRSIIVDDRLIFPTYDNWYFGKDNTGDITDPSFLKDFNKYMEGKCFFDLVTADGSFDCIRNPAEQESVVSDLHFSEMLIALHSLAPEGSFVLKKFTFFESSTICKLFFLNCVFEKVHVFKPFTSRHGNSEVYVICLGYIGVENIKGHLEAFYQNYNSAKDKAMFPRSSIPESFISQVIECSSKYFEYQKKEIIENVTLFTTPRSEYKSLMEQVQIECGNLFVERYDLVEIIPSSIRHMCPLSKQIVTSFHVDKKRDQKAQYFNTVGETFENSLKSKSMSWQETVLDVENRLNVCFPTSKKRGREEELVWPPVDKDLIYTLEYTAFEDAKWILRGKKINTIQNSKFCNPLILYLWNRISQDPQIDFEAHAWKSGSFWELEPLSVKLLSKHEAESLSLLYVCRSNNEDPAGDPLWGKLKETFNKCSVHNLLYTETKKIEKITSGKLMKNKIVYINTTRWFKSLHQELMLKRCLPEILHKILMTLETGDAVIICIQSVLTRYTAGIIQMFSSMFQKHVCINPNESAPAACGQMWVFRYFVDLRYVKRILSHFKTVLEEEAASESSEILEIEPMSVLCGSYFYENLLDWNNKHMMQRLKSLISQEKCKFETAPQNENSQPST